MTEPGDRSFPPRQGHSASQGWGPPQDQWQPPPQQGYGPPPGYQQPPGYGYYPDEPPRRRRHRGLKIFAGVAGGLVVLIIIAAALGSKGKTPAAGAPAANTQPTTAATASSAPPAPARQTITYVVTGSAANVTYGPAGTSRKGHIPMHVTRKLRNPSYYSITAQLNGSGRVRCKILVDGKVISTAVATGSYNIASCEISKDPLSGKWSNTNSG
jgi:hypothetical protein